MAQGSNLLRKVLQTFALPVELAIHVVRLKGLKPLSFVLRVRYFFN